MATWLPERLWSLPALPGDNSSHLQRALLISNQRNHRGIPTTQSSSCFRRGPCLANTSWITPRLHGNALPCWASTTMAWPDGQRIYRILPYDLITVATFADDHSPIRWWWCWCFYPSSRLSTIFMIGFTAPSSKSPLPWDKDITLFGGSLHHDLASRLHVPPALDGTARQRSSESPSRTYNLATTLFVTSNIDVLLCAQCRDSGFNSVIGCSVLQATFNEGHHHKFWLSGQISYNRRWRQSSTTPSAFNTQTHLSYKDVKGGTCLQVVWFPHLFPLLCIWVNLLV